MAKEHLLTFQEREYLHTPDQCGDFVLSQAPRFSHQRYFGIQIRKFLYRRRTNTPYLSSESLAKLTDISIFSRKQLHKKVRRPQPDIRSLFIVSDLIEDLTNIQHHLPNLKVLVSGHSDRNFERPIEIPRTVETWYAQNSAISNDPRIRPLPIGLENLSLGRSGLKKYFKYPKEEKIEDRVLVPPFSPTNPIRRIAVLDCKSNEDCFEVITQMLYEEQYFELINNYRFVLCLEGNGFDTHRIWETLYLGSFPVVLRTSWSSNLAELNLPILMIDSITEVNAELLKQFRQQNSLCNPLRFDPLWTPYWEERFSSL